MNKPPQPITGPTSVPNPAPSPGLTQAAYGPGQPTSLVFAPPPPPQMNSASQPRQSYYQNRPVVPTSAPRVQTTSGPRPVGPTHVYPSSSQMMMISQQQLSFTGSPQGYFIPTGQYRTPYIPPTQQYPVTTGTAGFYPGTSPAEYSAYAGAYYPAQPQYSPSVQPAQVMINPAQQQQQTPPPQQPPAQSQGPAKRERKPIRIRDPNQGGRDITEEIMSGGRSATTPTPPQSSTVDASPAQTNGEVTQPVTPVTRRDENVEPQVSAETPPPPATANTEPLVEAKQEVGDQMTLLPESAAHSVVVAAATEAQAPLLKDVQSSSSSLPSAASSTPPPETASKVDTKVGDTVDAPVGPLAPLSPKEVTVKMEEPQSAPAARAPEKEEKKEKLEESEEEEPVASAEVEPAAEVAATVNPVNTAKEESATKAVTEVCQPAPSEAEPAEPQTRSPAPISASEPEPTLAETAERPLYNGLPQDTEELSEETALTDTTPLNNPDTAHSQESTTVVKTAIPAQGQEVLKEEKNKEESENAPLSTVSCPTEDSTTMQAATSVPKNTKNMKELNEEATGDLQDAFTEEQGGKPSSEPSSTQASPDLESPSEPSSEPPAEVANESCEEKEDKQNTKPDKPKSTPELTEQQKMSDSDEKKRYDRDFLLGCQFISASMHKPEGLPIISDVVLDKVNKTPLRPADPARLMNIGPDFTPSYLGNLGSRSVGGPRGPPPGPRRSQQGQRKEPRKIISSMSLSDEVQLNKAEKAWKPSVKKSTRGRNGEEVDEDDPEQMKTQELLKNLRSILNKLTPQKFQDLMKQVQELTIDTEDRLKGAIDLIFEKAILEPSFSVAYANMCRCLTGLKVPTADKPGLFVNFRKLLLNRCQKEFEKDQDDDEIFEKKQKELEAAKEDEERERLIVELEEARDKARRRSLGNIKFIGELFKLKMLTEPIMHDCVVKLLKNHDEESLECLCRLLSTIGKDLDFEKAKPRMDQYFNQMDKIIKERKTSSRIRFMLQDVLDLRKNNWVPRRGDQGPKTIDQIHKEAKMEEQREQIKVQQQLLSKRESGSRMGGSMGGRGPGGGRTSQPQDEGWNTVPISKNRPIDTTRLSKITKPGALDFNNQLLAPGGKGMWGSWGKGSSGGSGAKPTSAEQDSGRSTTSTLNRFSALQQSGSLLSSTDSDRRVPQRSSSSRERGGDRERGDRDRDRFERYDRSEGRQGRDERNSQNQISKRSFSRESRERDGRGRDIQDSIEPVRRVASMTDDRDRGSRDRGSGDKGQIRDLTVKKESAHTTPSLPKPALTEEEVEKKSKAITEEYLHINDVKEAIQCVTELNSASLLYVFVRHGVESTLERSTKARESMALLLHQLVKAGTLPSQQYYKGLEEILEAAEDMAIDIPHIWLYLAELITPMIHEGGIPMGQLLREISKPLVPVGQAGVLLVKILKLLCKEMTPKKVGAMWTDAGLNWSDFLPEDQDVNKFVTDQKVEFTLGEDTESKDVTKKKVLSGEELTKQLDRLLQDQANNQRIIDWVEANLDEAQSASNQFLRALMTSVCQSAIICDNSYRVDAQQIKARASLLHKYLCDEQKELQALYALQALMVHMEQPANLLRMFFDALYDEDVIKEEAFYKWESSKDPAEQTGKGVALKSVTAFFTWLREAEEESDKE